MAATRGPQVVLEGYARAVARGGGGRTMRENIAAMDALVAAGLVADGNSVDGSARNGGKPYDTVIAQFPDEPVSAWEIPAPLLKLGFGSQIWNNTAANPVVPGWGFSAIYGPNAAVDIYGMVLNVPPRNTFNVIEGVLTLPATVTTPNTYHTAVSGFSLSQSATSVCFPVGAYAVAGADNCQTGAFGSVSVDSPHTTGIYNNVRLQNEYDWYTGNAGSSVRGTLHDGYFKVAPNTSQNYIAFSNNIFDGSTVLATASFSGTVMTVSAVSLGTFAVGMRLQATGVDGTAYTTITSFGTGTGTTGTYNLSANVGTIASTSVRASASFLWNIAFQSPDGASQVAFDVGQRNFATTLSVGSKSQINQWRYTDQTVATERIMQQWVEPQAAGGILVLHNYFGGDPASYGIENNSLTGAAFMGKNHAGSAFLDMLHLDVNDRTVLGAGSAVTTINTTFGPAFEALDDNVTVTASVALKGGTATAPGRIYVPTSNLALANIELVSNATTGFVSAYPVIAGAPTAAPSLVAISTAYGCYNTATKNLNIYDPLSSAWYHVALTAGAA